MADINLRGRNLWARCRTRICDRIRQGCTKLRNEFVEFCRNLRDDCCCKLKNGMCCCSSAIGLEETGEPQTPGLSADYAISSRCSLSLDFVGSSSILGLTLVKKQSEEDQWNPTVEKDHYNLVSNGNYLISTIAEGENLDVNFYAETENPSSQSSNPVAKDRDCDAHDTQATTDVTDLTKPTDPTDSPCAALPQEFSYGDLAETSSPISPDVQDDVVEETSPTEAWKFYNNPNPPFIEDDIHWMELEQMQL